MLGQLTVEHVIETSRFGGVAVLGIRGLARIEMQEMMRLTKHRAKSTHLPHQPLDDAQPFRPVRRKKLSCLFRQIKQDRTRFHQADPFLAIDDGRDLVVRIEGQELGRHLVVCFERNPMRFVGQVQLLQRDRDLYAVRCWE